MTSNQHVSSLFEVVVRNMALNPPTWPAHSSRPPVHNLSRYFNGALWAQINEGSYDEQDAWLQQLLEDDGRSERRGGGEQLMFGTVAASSTDTCRRMSNNTRKLSNHFSPSPPVIATLYSISSVPLVVLTLFFGRMRPSAPDIAVIYNQLRLISGGHLSVDGNLSLFAHAIIFSPKILRFANMQHV